MLNKIRKQQKGFTIIEVLIVLAIAGLILLIVFLAVPALQRNSRNTTLKNDASSVAGGISEYASNNNGAVPTTVTKTAGSSDVAISGTGSGVTPAQARVNGASDVATTTSVPGSLNPGQIRVRLGNKCDGTASTRAAAIYHAVERATGTPTVACLDA